MKQGDRVSLFHPKWSTGYEGHVLNTTEFAVTVKLDNGDIAKVHPSVVTVVAPIITESIEK